ncbi:MAG: hypothetical protein VZR09_09585 [Candidatus Gastranaerophilaceae bacterium]|nr:hypothetical protein [Candidatus Gastranaerophilaceae bacterium]
MSDIQALEIGVNRYIDRLPELGRNSNEKMFQNKSFELIQTVPFLCKTLLTL